MAINTIKETLEKKGLENIIPNKTRLQRMGITIKGWNRWVRKTSDPDTSQLQEIASLLDCRIDDIIPTAKESL